jgi:hypothetical protein
MGYTHTQRAPLHWLLSGYVLLLVVLAFVVPLEAAWVQGLLLVVAASVLFLAFCFRCLTVRDEGDALAVRFGPIALFRRSVPYAAMRGAKRARSAILDGWGVHWFPGRGWTMNLWGRDCVEIELERGLLRVGTDDPDGLTAFLEARLRGGTA